ncbi:hypothetical protein Tco_0446276 [Tanacetum coccineum]
MLLIKLMIWMNMTDYDELNTAKVALMVNLSHYGLDALTEINLENKSVNDTLTAELESYKDQVKVLNEGQSVDLKSKNNISDSCAQVNERLMQSKEGKVDSSKALNVGLIVTESNETESETHVSSSRSRNDTHVEDADISSVNDKQPMAEVQLSAEHNILANEQQHSEQSESIYDTYLLEKVNRNTTPDSTYMSHRGGEIDQNAEKCQVSCPLLDPSFDNMTTKFSNQFLKSRNISLKKTVAQLQKDFSKMEAHSIKREIEVLETINIELEHSVAKLLAENEKLHKENKHLKQTYKDLYDSIKKTRVQTIDHNDSLIAQINIKTIENADLKAQIQEKVFANAALKNE